MKFIEQVRLVLRRGHYSLNTEKSYVCKECGKIYKYDNKTQLFLDDNEKPTEQYYSSIFDTLVKF